VELLVDAAGLIRLAVAVANGGGTLDEAIRWLSQSQSVCMYAVISFSQLLSLVANFSKQQELTLFAL
jgi:hypothetical protein